MTGEDFVKGSEVVSIVEDVVRTAKIEAEAKAVEWPPVVKIVSGGVLVIDMGDEIEERNMGPVEDMRWDPEGILTIAGVEVKEGDLIVTKGLQIVSGADGVMEVDIEGVLEIEGYLEAATDMAKNWERIPAAVLKFIENYPRRVFPMVGRNVTLSPEESRMIQAEIGRRQPKKSNQSCDSDPKGGPRQYSNQLEEGEILNSSGSSKASPSPGTSFRR